MKNSTKIIIAIILTIAFAAGMFYVSLPAINLQSDAFWIYLLFCGLFFIFVYSIMTSVPQKKQQKGASKNAKAKDILEIISPLETFPSQTLAPSWPCP